MEERTVVKRYLHALWESTLQQALTVIDILALLALLIIVIDDWIKGLCALVFASFWLWSSYSIFKRQQEHIEQLKASSATEQRSIDATLSLLTASITQNLQMLTTYLETVHQRSESSSDPTQRSLALATAAIELNGPAWSSTVWETQIPLLTKALSTDQLQQVQVLFSRLEQISAILSKLQGLMGEQQENLRADRYPDGGRIVMGVAGPPRKFDKNAPVLWDRLEQIAHTLIAEGSPLECRDH